jgi:hypothetical protein
LFVDVDGFDVDLFKHITTEAGVATVSVIPFYHRGTGSIPPVPVRQKKDQVLDDAAVRRVGHFG